MLIALFLTIGTGVAGAERLAVSSGIANIRSGPGNNHDVIWKVEKYYPLDIIEKSDNWYLFRDYENDRGWIHKSMVDNTPTVITKQAENNIRSGPGKDHDILITVESGVPFKVVERKGDWIRLEHADGDRGWIHKSLVW